MRTDQSVSRQVSTKLHRRGWRIRATALSAVRTKSVHVLESERLRHLFGVGVGGEEENQRARRDGD